jgi:hypothetical protein
MNEMIHRFSLKNIRVSLVFLIFLTPNQVLAHHGVAGLGVAGLKGPGAPTESATSSTLPYGKSLLFFKLDHANYETFDSDITNPESEYANFYIAGLGYGFSSWFSGYLFVPYNSKVDEAGGFDTHGFADISLFGQFGFKYDEGFRLIPENESLDDLEDWHFTLFGGLTLPTGNPNLRDNSNAIDPGKSTGFGKPSYSIGVTATTVVLRQLTFNQEISYLGFQKYSYDDGNSTKFGSEFRANSALIYRLFTDMKNKLRFDVAFEGLYLHLGRDTTNDVGELATGGDILYLLPGVRFYWKNYSVALGYKTVIWKDLNEQSRQQGGEGTEDFRFILTLSALFDIF